MAKATAIVIVLSLVLGSLLFSFRVPAAKSANFVGQTIYLRADGSIEPLDAPVDVHGTTYTLTGDIQCPRTNYCIYVERGGILLDGDGHTIEGWNSEKEPSSSGFAIYAGFITSVEIRNIILKGCASGIETQSVSQVSIRNTTIDGQTRKDNSEAIGIDVMSCDSASLDQNYIVNNYLGILVQSSNCTITNSQIMHNTGGGIVLAGSGNRLISNLIAKNDLGVEIQAPENVIQDNDILCNNRIGILLGAANNLFVGNNIVGHNETNAYGVQMGPYESGNTFRHNDFENNYINVEGGDSAPIPNVWDGGYPLGGNYWDTYQGADNYSGPSQNESESDGIGDTRYQITTANLDRYPLIQPVRSNPDISEERIAENDYTLLIAILLIAIICVIVALIIIYWRRRKEETFDSQQ